MDRLRRYAWPGNVREFENMIEYMVNMMPADGVIRDSLLPPRVFDVKGSCTCGVQKKETPMLTLEEMEKQAIVEAMDRFGNDTKGKHTAAMSLGIGIATLYRKIRKYGLDR